MIRLALLCTCIITLCAGGDAFAGGTRTWRLTSYKDFEEGEATGVLLSSLGEATSGFSASRIDVNESVVYSSVSAPDGTTFIGTGDQGVVYAYKGGKLRKLAKLDAVLVSSLAAGPNGSVFAGTMPGGRVFAIDRDGKVREAAKLDAEHVWALVYDEGKQMLVSASATEESQARARRAASRTLELANETVEPLQLRKAFGRRRSLV